MSICSRFKPSTERHPCLVFSPPPQTAQFPSTPTPRLSLFSLSDRLIHTIAPPVPSVCLGAGQGWLVLCDLLADLSLFNPLTNDHLRNLPKLSTLPHVTPIHDPTTLRIRSFSVLRNPPSLDPFLDPPELFPMRLISRALVVPDPAQGGGLTVVLMLSKPFMAVAWAKPGDDKWTMVENSDGLDFICHKDQIFTVMFYGSVIGWGVDGFIPLLHSSHDIKFLAEDLKEKRELLDKIKLIHIVSRMISFFLVSTPSGDLWRVRKERSGSTSGWSMTVHKVMVDGESKSGAKLRRVKDLGENAILLGGNAAICVSTAAAPELKRNRIYFAEGSMDQPWTEAGVYSMEDGSIEPMLPSMIPPYPRPSWIMMSHA